MRFRGKDVVLAIEGSQSNVGAFAVACHDVVAGAEREAVDVHDLPNRIRALGHADGFAVVQAGTDSNSIKFDARRADVSRRNSSG